ncbi:MAG: zinc ABC transporter substrate-binding protein [Spirochaetaceae bacterium]|nr:zinc ABC transporter substrate-binding protein [Spirochaetaceae bacterium]
MKKVSGFMVAKIFFLTVILMLPLSCQKKVPTQSEDNKKTVLCTTFSVYDWVRNILGNNSDITPILLFAGVDMHNFFATAETFVTVSQSDLLVTVGGISEHWTDELPQSMQPKSMLKLSSNSDEDEHIWLSLRDATSSCEKIRDKLIEVFPEEKARFTENCRRYIEEIWTLERELSAIASENNGKKVIFADRFPFGPFFHDEIFTSNDIECFAAFSSCGTESAASFNQLVFLGEKIQQFDVKTIFVSENSDKKIATSLMELIDRKDISVVELDSMQIVSWEEINSGKSYLKTMAENISVLREGLR